MPSLPPPSRSALAAAPCPDRHPPTRAPPPPPAGSLPPAVPASAARHIPHHRRAHGTQAGGWFADQRSSLQWMPSMRRTSTSTGPCLAATFGQSGRSPRSSGRCFGGKTASGEDVPQLACPGRPVDGIDALQPVRDVRGNGRRQSSGRSGRAESGTTDGVPKQKIANIGSVEQVD